MKPSDIRRALKAKRLFILPYCHADIAWEHTRRWHVDRYVLAFDEMLELMDREPGFRYFIDTWCEMLEPCLRYRPEAVGRVRRLLAQKRLALCGGHWGNLRMTQVGDETILRNLVLGRRAVRRLFPEADLRVYANLDVAIGHSQVPQIMKLAGCPYYFCWRPQAALDAAGVPRTFWWEGLSGDRLLVTRHSYGGLVSKEEQPAAGWEADWPATLQTVWRYVEVPARQKGLPVLSFCAGMDDGRPLRAWHGDAWLDLPGLVAAWNRREKSRLAFGTPLDVFEALEARKAALPTRAGMLDGAEVCYNAANHGRQGLWWLRERADRRLVEAEVLASLASLVKGQPYPVEAMTQAWHDLLMVCPHAVQDLFVEDFVEFRFRAQRAIDTADRLADEALGHLTAPALGHDSTGLTVVNPLPEARREVVRVLLPNADRARRSVGFLDAAGRPVRTQLLETVVHVDEFDLLVAVDLPACGSTTLGIAWSDQAAAPPSWQALPGLEATLESDRLRVGVSNGRLRRIEDKKTGCRIEAADGCGFLAPVFYPYVGPTWLPASMEEKPTDFEPQELRLDETGPLRWRLTRKGRLGPHAIVQHVDLLAGEPVVEVSTQIVLNQGPVSYVGLAVPLPSQVDLTVDIPFGLEGRQPDQDVYGRVSDRRWDNIERRIPGLFWARSWVRAAWEEAAVALMAVDGDRYFYLGRQPRLLAHVLLRQMHRPERGWEARAALGDEVGTHTFRHALVVGKSLSDEELVSRTARYRHPVRWLTTRQALGRQRWLSVAPRSVRLSAFYQDEGAWLLRLVQMADQRTQAVVELPVPVRRAAVVDLEGRRLRVPCQVRGRRLRVGLKPWQIATVRLEVEP